MKKGVLRNFTKFTGKHLCQSLRSVTLLRCEFCETSKNNFFTEHLWTTASEFVTEILIFRSSHSQMFFKISDLKDFAILVPLANNKVADLFLQNTYGGCFWIFVAANTFLQLNMVFIADSRTGFCSGLLWKDELNLRSSHRSCSVKNVFLENLQISRENDRVEVSLGLQLFKKETPTQTFSSETYEIFRNT